MRLPGAALLITIGLILLYLATSGNLDRLGKAWQTILHPSDANLASGLTAPPCDPSSGICDLSKYATQSLLHTLAPTVAVTNPGGMV